MFSASLRRCNGAKCWLYAFTDGKRGAEWVFVNCRLGFSTNAEKEQLSAAQAGPEMEGAGEQLALCATALQDGHRVTGNGRGGNETQDLILMPPAWGRHRAAAQHDSRPQAWKSLTCVFLICLVSCLYLYVYGSRAGRGSSLRPAADGHF